MRRGRTQARNIRFVVGTLVALAGAVVAAGGCGAVESSAPLTPDGMAAEAAAPVHGITACGRCVAEACARERRGCAAEATCTKYLACADACSSIDGGNIDPACEAACPRPSDPAGVAAFDAFSTCRTRGAGAACEACGGGLARYRSPLLKQVCGPPPSPLPEPHLCTGGDAAREALLKCTKCNFERCCDSRAARDTSASSVALLSCLRVCPDLDSAGEDKCHADFAAALPAFAQNFACLSIRCADACGAPSACGTCSNTFCGDENAAVRGSVDGFLLATCTGRCGDDDTACVDACIARFPALRQPLIDVTLCDAQYCSEVCALQK